jgi:hypothetical protein
MSAYFLFYIYHKFLVISSILTILIYLSWKDIYFENMITSKSQKPQAIIFALIVCTLMCT